MVKILSFIRYSMSQKCHKCRKNVTKCINVSQTCHKNVTKCHKHVATLSQNGTKMSKNCHNNVTKISQNVTKMSQICNKMSQQCRKNVKSMSPHVYKCHNNVTTCHNYFHNMPCPIHLSETRNLSSADVKFLMWLLEQPPQRPKQPATTAYVRSVATDP